MTEDQVFDKVREVLVEHLDLEESHITPESSLRDDLGASSLELAELVLEFEKQTNTVIELEDLADVNTVVDVVGLIMSKLDG